MSFLLIFAAIPSLRARDCSKNEKEALNYLFLLIPLLNVIIPFFWKSFAVVWSADTIAFLGMYAWKVYICVISQKCPILFYICYYHNSCGVNMHSSATAWVAPKNQLKVRNRLNSIGSIEHCIQAGISHFMSDV